MQSALAVGGDAGDLLLAEGVAEVVERRAVADPGAEQAGAVVGDDRFGAVAAPAVGGLADVLKTLSSCTPWPGPVEAISSRLGSGAMFADLIQREQQRGVDRLAGRARSRANAPAVMSATSAANRPRRRRWSSAGAIR